MSEQRAGADLGGNPGDAGPVGDRGSTGPVLWQGRDLLQCVRTVPHVEEAALFLGTEKQAKVDALQPAGRVIVSSTTRLADCILLRRDMLRTSKDKNGKAAVARATNLPIFTWHCTAMAQHQLTCCASTVTAVTLTAWSHSTLCCSLAARLNAADVCALSQQRIAIPLLQVPPTAQTPLTLLCGGLEGLIARSAWASPQMLREPRS